MRSQLAQFVETEVADACSYQPVRVVEEFRGSPRVLDLATE